MRAIRYILRPGGPWSTPWHADSLFGALCWAYRDAAGPERLEELLDEFREGSPPFVLSDAFPAELLPFPVGAPFVKPEDRKLKPLWTPVESFRRFAAGEIGCLPIARSPLCDATRARVSLSRANSMVSEGSLFEVEMESFGAKTGSGALAVYVAATEKGRSLFRHALAVLERTGFGKKASTGAGTFQVEGVEDCSWLEAGEGANAFVALSHFVPAPADPADGAWRLHTTYPKFHRGRSDEFLKGRLILMTPGSWFQVEGEVKAWYGRMVPMKHAEHPKALHYAMCLAAPLRRVA
jgi:CRISPR-associated protein Csm4